MTVSAADQALFQIVSGPEATSVDEVLAKMKQIDGALPDNDGLKWFNRLYMMVTEEVDLRPAATWKDAVWLDKLDVVFAGLYFKAVASYVSQSADAPNAWDALMESRFRGGIDRIQFALAGMNAHINHDLALALNETNSLSNINPNRLSPQYTDYDAVNQLLNDVTPRALNVLAAGVLGQLAQDTGKVGRLLAFWNIVKARELAWQFADHLRQISGIQRQIGLAAQDQVTGVVGRAILICA
jgi:hypothetical protein